MIQVTVAIAEPGEPTSEYVIVLNDPVAATWPDDIMPTVQFVLRNHAGTIALEKLGRDNG